LPTACEVNWVFPKSLATPARPREIFNDSGGFVVSAAAPIAGWSDQLPGGYHSR